MTFLPCPHFSECISIWIWRFWKRRKPDIDRTWNKNRIEQRFRKRDFKDEWNEDRLFPVWTTWSRKRENYQRHCSSRRCWIRNKFRHGRMLGSLKMIEQIFEHLILIIMVNVFNVFKINSGGKNKFFGVHRRMYNFSL